MKKSLKITFTVVGAAVAVIGAGVLGGTYGSYSNYQALLTIYNIGKKEAGSNASSLPSFDKGISQWNEAQAKMSADERNTLNKQNQAAKDAFYKQYPTFNDYENAMSKGGYYTKDQIQDLYNEQVATFSINYNYNADQGGVIAGSVLLAIGLVAFIAFLVILLKKKKTVQ